MNFEFAYVQKLDEMEAKTAAKATSERPREVMFKF